MTTMTSSWILNKSSSNRAFKRPSVTWLRLTPSTLFVAFITLFYAWNSSIQSPLLYSILWNKPQHTIFMLSILSQVTATLFGIMINDVRWNLGSRPEVSTFLAVSEVASPLQHLLLFFSRSVEKDSDQSTKHSFLRRIKTTSFPWSSALT